MRLARRGASSAALLVGLAAIQSATAQQSNQANQQNVGTPQSQTVTTAQQAPQSTTANAQQVQTTPTAPAAAQGSDRVVIVGSLIATAPEDAPKPVEVYTAEDLKKQGSPSISEFVRSLTLNYGSNFGFGQASATVTSGAGFASANLRGLGSNATLVLQNGRRLSSTNGGFGADLNTIPAEALEAVEILKDGASATYGAGAVGGVINFRTRRDIDAPEISIERTMYDGGEGAYKLDFLTGWVGDASNLMMSYSHSHEEPMRAVKRDFANQPFSVNPAGWSLTSTNPGRFHRATSFYTTTTGGVLSGSEPEFNQANCEAIGGEIISVLQPGATGSTNNGCAYPQAPFTDLVNENTIDRLYGEFNADINENMEMHFEVTYSKSESITRNDPIGASSTTRGGTAGRATSGLCINSCNYVIPTQVQIYTNNGTSLTGASPATGTGVYVQNPFIAAYNNWKTLNGGTPISTAPGGALFTSTQWRPFLFGGNPFTESGRDERTYQRERLIVGVGLKGEFQSDGLLSFLNGINYDYAGQYNQYQTTNIEPDIFVSRLQNALLGYGGPNCNAIDRVPTDYSSAANFNRTAGIQSDTAPGTNGCQWYNPFASAWQTSFVSGATNPAWTAANAFGAPTLAGNATPRPTGYANPMDLLDWLYNPGLTETKNEAATFDALWTGELPDAIALPGGAISWAVGSQWRQTERRDFLYDPNDNEEEEAMLRQDCPWNDPAVVNIPAQPNQSEGQLGCATTVGAFFTRGRPFIPPQFTDSQTLAYFFELRLPVLDNLNFQASARRESFNGGDLEGDIWSVAGKWDITDNIYLRASYGTNFRAEAALDLTPGATTFANDFGFVTSRFGAGYTILAATTVAPDIAPEEDNTLNVGVGYSGDLFGGRLRASVDFFRAQVKNEVGTTTTSNVYNNVFGVNGSTTLFDPDGAGPITPTPSSSNQYADCSASLISFLVFDNNNSCTTGVTTVDNVVNVIRYQIGGPGFTTESIDYSIDYSHPLFDGDLAFQLQATQNLSYQVDGYDLFGIPFQAGTDCLGKVNFQVRGCVRGSEFRGNATVRWANDRHSMSLRANYTQGVYDQQYDTGTGLTAIDVTNNVYSTYGIFPEDYLDFDVNYFYTAPFWEDLEFRATILNITDEDPLGQQNANGYYVGIGNPRGRQFEIGVTKKF